ncbi:MAG: prepilin peptidase [Lachnospiraceae bacterium]|nr:prepilin peptidase [Lachnospiraceae bacterium]
MTLVLFVSLLRRFCAAPLLLLISLSDIRKRRVPDGLLLPLAALSLLRLISAWETACEPAALLALRTLLFEVLPGGAGMLLLLLPLTLLLESAWKKKVLGGGDIKLAAALGLHLGLPGALRMLFLACLLALPQALICFCRKRGDQAFPFAPYLSAAGLAGMLL